MKHLVAGVVVVVLSFSTILVNGEVTQESICLDEKNGRCQNFVTQVVDHESGGWFFWKSPVYQSMIGAFLVGLSGIVPIVWLTSPEEMLSKKKSMNRALSFASGALLGDVFLHILPETWKVALDNETDLHQHSIYSGISILLGIISFFVLEKIMAYEDQTETQPTANENDNNNVTKEAQNMSNRAGIARKNGKEPQELTENKIESSGYLNLIANCLDNFTHGLAIGGSFVVSSKLGWMTTGAILLHEIPHEFGDFAILLRAGFKKWDAAKMQMITSTGGLIGALSAHFINTNSVWWILPFTAGGFLHIALCTIIPELMEDTASKKESIIQLLIMIAGISVMGIVGLAE